MRKVTEEKYSLCTCKKSLEGSKPNQTKPKPTSTGVVKQDQEGARNGNRKRRQQRSTKQTGKEGAAQERNGVEAATRVSSTLRQPSTSGGMYAWMISIHKG